MFLSYSWLSVVDVVVIIIMAVILIIVAGDVYRAIRSKEWAKAGGVIGYGLCLQSGFLALRYLVYGSLLEAAIAMALCIAWGTAVRYDYSGTWRNH
jgi:hypothetical protein